jgi:ABC-type nitrate/sulfonate/bicarbonate transport system ATPase subunit
MIEVYDLTFGFQQPLFEGFSWQVDRGEHWTVLGPSGCGKTTLLKLLAGVYKPEAGTIRIDGNVLTRPRPETGLILQNYGLLPWATVWSNVALGLRIRRFYGQDGVHTPKDKPLPSRSERHEIVEYWLNRLGIWQQRRQFPGQLSGGQQQRVAIARTLALEPDLLLMDEPFNSLDAPTRERLQNLVLELRAEFNITTIIVTHAVDEAAVLGSSILFMGDPPHSEPTIINNLSSEDAAYRTSTDYLDMRNLLRQRMGVG